MPLSPLPEHPCFPKRTWHLVRVAPFLIFLVLTLAAGHLVQLVSLILVPVSRRAFRCVNTFLVRLWFSWCVVLSRWVNGARIVLTGDDIPELESAIVVLNHQSATDMPLIMTLAWAKRRVGDIKWFAKYPVKFIPFIGWGLHFVDTIFVRRDWHSDRERLERTFRRLVGSRLPMWVISFSEGTRLTAAKLARAREYARDRRLAVPTHVLVPRTKGFVASVQRLRGQVDAVYDVTIGYVGGVPSLWQYIRGFASVAHLHVRRYPLTELAESPEALASWLHERFHEKDQLLDWFYSHGSFPGDPHRDLGDGSPA